MTSAPTTGEAAAVLQDGARNQPIIENGAAAPTSPADPPRSDRSHPDQAFRIADFLEPLGLIVAPTSIITTLLFWMGFVRTEHFCRYFGIHHSMLEFSVRDYVLRSMDVVYPSLCILFVSIIAILGLHRLVQTQFQKNLIWTVQMLSRLLLVVGVLAAPVAVNGLFPGSLADLDLFHLTYRSRFLPPVFGVLATGSLGYAFHLRGRIAQKLEHLDRSQPRWVSRGMFASVSGLLILSTFWAGHEYAIFVGTHAAAAVQKSAALPTIDIYSRQPLYLGDGQMKAREFPVEAKGYRFTYLGFRLLLRSAGKYFILPEDMKSMLVLEDSSNLRFEHHPYAG